METLTLQQELIDWIHTIKDEKTLTELSELKRRAVFNFDDEFKKGISLAEAKQRSIEKITQYWKK